MAFDINSAKPVENPDDQHGPSEDYQAPPTKEERKAAAFRPMNTVKDDTTEAKQFRKKTLDIENRQTREEGVATIKQGLTDPYYGGKQLLKHALPEKLVGKDAGKEADEEIRQREIEYRKEVPEGGEALRTVGNIIGGAPIGLGPAGGTTASIARGVISSLAQPITDTSEVPYEKQKVQQGVVGGVVGVVPDAAKSLTRKTLRGGWTGGEAGNAAAGQALKDNVSTFKRAGVTPTLGQVSEGGLTKGAGAFEGTKEKQRAELAKKSQGIMDKLGTPQTKEETGRVIESGIAGEYNPVTGKREGGWLQRFKDEQTTKYEKADKLLPPDTKTFLPKTFAAFREVTTPSKKAPSTSGAFVDPKLQDLHSRLYDDTGKSRSLPLEEVKALRSNIGEMIDDPTNMAPGMKISSLRKVYSALTADMEDLAKRAGPKAYNAMKDANSFTRDGHDKLETFLQPVIDQKIPEKIFNAATAGTKDGASQVRTVLESLNPAQADAVKATFFNHMLSGSPIEFFNRWNTIHPDAKEVLFGKQGAKMRRDIDSIAQVAAAVGKKGSQLDEMRKFAMGHAEEGGVAALAYLTHQHGLTNVLLGGAGLGFLSGRSKLMSNPKFLDWLAKSSTKTPGTLITSLNSLANMSRDMSPEDQKEVSDYISQIRSLGTPE